MSDSSDPSDKKDGGCMMRFEINSPMFFGGGGFGEGTLRRKPVHFKGDDCRECGGVCKHPELDVPPPEPQSKRRYPKIRRARVKYV